MFYIISHLSNVLWKWRNCSSSLTRIHIRISMCVNCQSTADLHITDSTKSKTWYQPFLLPHPLTGQGYDLWKIVKNTEHSLKFWHKKYKNRNRYTKEKNNRKSHRKYPRLCYAGEKRHLQGHLGIRSVGVIWWPWVAWFAFS